MEKYIEQLIDISQYAGQRVDYTQGGGGNTSVKSDDARFMFIKASGYKLKEVSKSNAFVCVDQKKIFNFYNSKEANDGCDHEEESSKLAKTSVIEVAGAPLLRPSVEVGFHSILKKYVIHTHSIYANIIACSVQGEDIANSIFTNKDYGFVFLPYINPGFELTIAMKNAIEKYSEQYGKFPQVIFMKNHGLVVTADSLEMVKEIHTDVNLSIIKHFGLNDDLQSICLEQTENGFVSNTNIVKSFVKDYGLNLEFLSKYPLYPDQLVYLNNTVYNSPDSLVVKNGKVFYNTDIKQATTLEETLSAYAFVIKTIKEKGLDISLMSDKDVAFINGWEAEKYRKSIK